MIAIFFVFSFSNDIKAQANTGVLLPNGQEFVFWEAPLKFT
jgi:hypothetical protein